MAGTDHVIDGGVVNFRWQMIEDKVLLTSDHGSWSLLDEDKFNSLFNGNIDNKKVINELIQKGLIRCKKNEAKIRKMLEKWKSSSEGGPFLHIITTTNRCNYNCSYCHASAKPVRAKNEDLTIDTARQIVDFIMQSPSESILIEFQGGESLLNFEVVKDIVQYTSKIKDRYNKKVSFTLVSNLSLISEDILDFLSQNRITLCSSIDGDKKTHNCHRKINNYGTFSLTMKKRGLAQKQGISIPFISVVTKKTIKNYKKFVDFAIKEGQDTVIINPVQRLGFATDNWDEFGMSPELYIKYYKKILDYTFEKIKSGHFIIERRFSIALEKIFSDADTRFTDFRNPCGAFLGQVAYDKDGNIFCCDEARGRHSLILGNVKTDKFEEISESDKVKEITEASVPHALQCKTCVFKPFCGICPILNYAETGSYDLDPEKDSRCKINLFLFKYIFKRIINDPESILVILRYNIIKRALNNS